MKKLKWAVLAVVCAFAGVGVAALQARALGAFGPPPGALMPDRLILVDDGPRRLMAMDSSFLGIRQYGMEPEPSQAFLDNQPFPFEEGVVPGWVLLPEPGRNSISRGFGWPLVALTGTEVYEDRLMVETPGYAVGPRGSMMPTQVRPGLLVNGLFFGGVLLGLVWGIGKVWGRLRERKAPAGATATG
ncbi:MAG: hypothetical protein JJU33_11750 [Phycisphaerales bacterium]|nr:hypothetical protein [Phycisphaerales bacterium]